MAVSERMEVATNGLPELAPEERKLLDTWNDRVSTSRSHRRSNYEGTWSLCRHFLAGRQWVTWDDRYNRIVKEKNPQKRERYTLNVVDQYVQTVLGKLYVEDLRPDIAFRRDDVESREVAEHTRALARYLWEMELSAEDEMYHLILTFLTYGTAAIRAFFDNTKGKELGEVPVGPDDQPILDPDQARNYVAELAQMGQQARFRVLREGRIRWQTISPMQMLVPPGVERAADFPWVILEDPVWVEAGKLRFPDKADSIRSEELTSWDRSPYDADSGSGGGKVGKLADHFILYCGYQNPSTEYPRGRTVLFSKDALLEVRDSLDYTKDGTPHNGIFFFHYHHIPGRFFGKGEVEDLIMPQREKNRVRSMLSELMERNMGRVYARVGTLKANTMPTGKIMELIEIPLHSDYPQETLGVPIGPWMENQATMIDQDMDRIAGLREVSLGTAPTGVEAYAAMALLVEQDDRRIGPVLKKMRQTIGDAMYVSLEMVRNYWMDGRHFAIAGPDGIMSYHVYKRAFVPDEFYINVSRSSPLPTSPALEAQKIFDIFHAAIAAGVPLPPDWLKDSLDQGRPLPFPKRESEVQRRTAQLENTMILQGQMMVPHYFDDDFLHITEHRDQQIELLNADQAAYQQQIMMLEQHIQMHVENAQMKAPTGGSASSVPQEQGGRGIEAQNGPVNMQGLAQNQSVVPSEYRPSNQQ